MPMRSIVVVLLLPLSTLAQTSPTPSIDEVGELLRPLLLESIPTKLYEKEHNWGHTSMVAHAVHWKGLVPHVVKTPRNDGTWRKIRVSTRNLPGTLVVRLSDLQAVDQEHSRFKGVLGFQAVVDFEQQVWESGVRLYSGSTRARVRVQLDMDCETTLRLETGKSVVPDIVFRMRIANAHLTYHDLVVEHTAGVGGSAAKLLGEATHSALKQWHPSLERKLIERANASIVKAADTKEIRLGLSGVGRNKAPKGK